MKLNLSYPNTGAQKLIEILDESKLRSLYDKRMSQEVDGENLGEEFKGYVFKISGGNDKQGFPMMQGVLLNHRIRLLLDKDSKCFRPRRDGQRKRKSIRGCIVGPDLAVVHLVIVKKGEKEIEGITDKVIPRRLGPKRASKIRKLFNLTKKDDVRKYVIRRELPERTRASDGKVFKRSKAPKIQRLVTPLTIQRRRHRNAVKKNRASRAKLEAAEYKKLIANRHREEARQVLISKRKSTRSVRISEKTSKKEEPVKKEEPKKKKAAPAKKEQPKAAKNAKAKSVAPAKKEQPKAKKAPAKSTQSKKGKK